MVENSRGDLNAKVKCNQHHLAGVQCTRYYAVNDTAVLVTFFIIRQTCVTQKCVLFTCFNWRLRVLCEFWQWVFQLHGAWRPRCLSLQHNTLQHSATQHTFVWPFGCLCRSLKLQYDWMRAVHTATHGNTAATHGNTAATHGNTAATHGNTAATHGNTAATPTMLETEHFRVMTYTPLPS